MQRSQPKPYSPTLNLTFLGWTVLDPLVVFSWTCWECDRCCCEPVPPRRDDWECDCDGAYPGWA